MALIKCPECSGQVSDKAKNCPHCGFGIVTCGECGAVVADPVEACSACGFLEAETQSQVVPPTACESEIQSGGDAVTEAEDFAFLKFIFRMKLPLYAAFCVIVFSFGIRPGELVKEPQRSSGVGTFGAQSQSQEYSQGVYTWGEYVEGLYYRGNFYPAGSYIRQGEIYAVLGEEKSDALFNYLLVSVVFFTAFFFSKPKMLKGLFFVLGLLAQYPVLQMMNASATLVEVCLMDDYGRPLLLYIMLDLILVVSAVFHLLMYYRSKNLENRESEDVIESTSEGLVQREE